MPELTEKEFERAVMIKVIFDGVGALKDKSDAEQIEGIKTLINRMKNFNADLDVGDQIDIHRILSYCLDDNKMPSSLIYSLQAEEMPSIKYVAEAELAENEKLPSTPTQDIDKIRTVMLFIEIINTKKAQEVIPPSKGKKLLRSVTPKKLNLLQENKSKVAFLQKEAMNFQNTNSTLAEDEISKIVSYCIDRTDFFRSGPEFYKNEQVILGLQQTTDKDHFPIYYKSNVTLKDLSQARKAPLVTTSQAIETAKQQADMGSTPPVTIHSASSSTMTHPVEPISSESPRRTRTAPAIPTSETPAVKRKIEPPTSDTLKTLTEFIQHELQDYKENIPVQTDETTGESKPFSRFPWSSDQAKKSQIVEGLVTELEKPLTAQNMGALLNYIRAAKKANRDATGSRLIHGAGRLETLLKNAEKQIIKTVPHGYVIDQLNQYIEKAKREDVPVEKNDTLLRKRRSIFESDREEKVKLAKDLLALYKNNTPPNAAAIKRYIEANKELTKGKYSKLPGFHRAGKLDNLLKYILNESDKQEKLENQLDKFREPKKPVGQ